MVLLLFITAVPIIKLFWWFGLAPAGWSLGFDSQTRETRENKRTTHGNNARHARKQRTSRSASLCRRARNLGVFFWGGGRSVMVAYGSLALRLLFVRGNRGSCVYSGLLHTSQDSVTVFPDNLRAGASGGTGRLRVGLS